MNGFTKRLFAGPLTLLTWVSLGIAFPHFAQSQSFDFAAEMQNSSATTEVSTEFRFYGRRFRGPESDNGQRVPVILAHGILNSYGVTEKLALYLEKQGFDVWTYNQPGFGQEGQVTKAISADRGEYGLMALVNGVDKMVEHVTKTTGQAPIFGGFSLGGIALELYLQGVTGFDAEGNAQVDTRKSSVRQKRLSRAMFLGAPVLSFSEMTRGLKLMYGAAYCTACIVGDKSGFLNLGLGRKNSLVSKVAGVTTAVVPNALLKFYLQDVTNYQNLDSDSRSTEQYLARRFSNIHMDLVRDLVTASKKVETLKASPLLHVDAIYIVGTKDGLANHKQVRNVFEQRRAQNQDHQLISVEDAGHLDLMENRVIEGKYGETLSERLKAPKARQWFYRCRDSFRAV